MKCALTTLCVFGAVTCALGYTDIPSSSSFMVNGVSYSYYDPTPTYASRCVISDYANGYSLTQTANSLRRLIVGYVDSRQECAVSPKPIGVFELASQFDWTASNGTVCHQEMNWIGPDAFLDCSDMTELNVGNGYIAMNDAFTGCSKLRVVRLPSTMQAIGASAFSGLGSLETVEIPSSLRYLGGHAFYNCRNLSSQVFIPASMICVCDYTFANCYKLPEVAIPDGVVKIGSSAFQNCYSWTKIELPQTVGTIGNYAFSGLSNVPSLTLAPGVTNIGSYAFSECSGLHDVYVGVDAEDPQDVRAVLGDGAFSNCRKLERVYIGQG